MMTAIPGQRRGNLTSFSPCSIDESYKYIFLPICYSFTFVFSLSLNSVVLYHSFRRTRHWNASLIYMVNLASTDLMYGLSLPFLVASYVMRDHWVFGDFMCRLTGDLTRAAQNGHLAESKLRPGPVEVVLNCWDDATDTEILLYIPYGIVLHLLGFFVPFTVIAWCYSHVVLTIIRTLRMQPCLQGVVEERSADCAGLRSGGVSLSLGPHSSYVRRRRKSVKTIITIILLFALCFFPFHVTRTIFFILKVTSGVECHTMRMVSICYKITRPLASFNAWLNALLYFLTKEKGAQCCPSPDPALHGLLWPLRAFGRGGEEEEGGGEVVDNKENESKSSGNRFRGLA
ncbi:P2Y purinoceptor 3-like isoform X1 [Brienomyrus brachyistius]|uniref:P2Y purinoceptor 3-like isoform X1 n=1 Tax=Brienomyrus brachyistius TaxID=42636 RepID=UPI0020B322AA|nr:P2Y purinoceptor 3-like isoform X1 [Brienomyrus brachyistius]